MIQRSARSVLLLLAAALALALGVTSVGAQDCPPGLTGENCNLVQTANQNNAGAQSFNLQFSQSINADITMMQIEIGADGSGPIVMDGSGNIVAADLVIPNATANLGMLGGSNTGAAGFKLVDGVMYFGTGDSVENLTWQSVALSDLSSTPNLTYSGLAGMGGMAGLGDLTDISSMEGMTDWTRNDSATTSTGESAVQFNSTVSGVSLSEIMAAAEGQIGDVLEEEAGDALGGLGGLGLGDLGTMMEGISGTLSTDTSIFVAPDGANLTEFSTAVDIALDMSEAMEGMGGTGGEGDSGTGGMGDMGAMFSNISVNVEMLANFSGFDQSYDIQAPAQAEPMGSSAMSTLNGMGGAGLPELLSTYFLEQGMSSAMGGAFGGDMGNNFGGNGGTGFSAAGPYAGNCTSNMGYEQVQAGSLAFGDTVSDSLNSAQADLWTFNGTSGQEITINMSSNTLDGYVELLGPDGSGVASDDDGAGYPNPLLNTTLESDGQYTIVACTFSAQHQPGDYELSLSQGAPQQSMFSGTQYNANCTSEMGYNQVQAGSISAGQTVTDKLGEAEADMWTFNGTSGQQLVVNMTSDTLDGYLELIGPDGSGVLSDDDGAGYPNPLLNTTLESDGEYTIVACTYSTMHEPGEYTLSVQSE